MIYSAILCEGNSDRILLSYYLSHVLNLSYYNDKKIKEKNIPFLKVFNRSDYDWYGDNKTAVVIIAVNGCNFTPYINHLLDYNEGSDGINYFGKFVVVTDNDDERSVEKRKIDISTLFYFEDKLKDSCWITTTMTNRLSDNLKISVLLILQPIDEYGALESFVLKMLANNNKDDSAIINYVRDFISGIKSDKYLKNRGEHIKAELSVTLSVMHPRRVFEPINSILKSIQWDKYTEYNNRFLSLQGIVDSIYVIRVDSSPVIGSGHLMRCLTLADKMKKEKNAEVHFICRDLEGNLSQLVVSHDHHLHLLPRAELDDTLEGYAVWLTVSQERDVAETISILREIIPEGKSLSRLVVDSYAIDVEWEQQLRPYTEEIFVIDDLANRKHDCDILLDQNSYLDKEHRYDGLVPKNCKLLLGHEHALLREEFYEAKKKMIPRDKRSGIKNILVFFGGADATNETVKALRALKSIESKIKDVTINVVVGGGNPHKADVKAFCDQNDNMRYLCQVNNMAELMAEADLAIGAGGTTTWERLFLGLSSIVICIADNQKKICEDCSRQGLINYLGMYTDVSEVDISEAIIKATR